MLHVTLENAMYKSQGNYNAIPRALLCITSLLQGAEAECSIFPSDFNIICCT